MCGMVIELTVFVTQFFLVSLLSQSSCVCNHLLKGSECEWPLRVKTVNLNSLEKAMDYSTASLACPAYSGL